MTTQAAGEEPSQSSKSQPCQMPAAPHPPRPKVGISPWGCHYHAVKHGFHKGKVPPLPLRHCSTRARSPRSSRRQPRPSSFNIGGVGEETGTGSYKIKSHVRPGLAEASARQMSHPEVALGCLFPSSALYAGEENRSTQNRPPGANRWLRHRSTGCAITRTCVRTPALAQKASCGIIHL